MMSWLQSNLSITYSFQHCTHFQQASQPVAWTASTNSFDSCSSLPFFSLNLRNTENAIGILQRTFPSRYLMWRFSSLFHTYYTMNHLLLPSDLWNTLHRFHFHNLIFSKEVSPTGEVIYRRNRRPQPERQEELYIFVHCSIPWVCLSYFVQVYTCSRTISSDGAIILRSHRNPAVFAARRSTFLSSETFKEWQTKYHKI